jgi:hypothetical protein
MINTLGLEFCDEGFLAAARVGEQERLVPLEVDGPSSPGFVYFNGSDYLAGREAENLSRIHPRIVTDTCWDQLSLRSSIISTGGKNPLFSELAFHHLKHLWSRLNGSGLPAEKVVFALPGHYIAIEDDEEELEIGLILSMARDLKIPLAGIVDMASASIIPYLPSIDARPFTALHLDIHQYNIVVTVISVSEEIERKHIVRFSELGYAHILSELMPKLANRFLSQTAFDVTHDGKTEQAFYNQIRRLIDELRYAPECSLELGGLKRPRQMVVTHDSLARDLDTVNDSIVQVVSKASSFVGDGPWSLFLSDRASRVPGLSNKLEGWKDCQIIHLDIASAAKGCATFAVDAPRVESLDQTPVITQIPIDESVFVTPNSKREGNALPADVASDSKESRPKAQPNPTHIVFEGISIPLVGDHFIIGTEIDNDQSGLRISSDNKAIAKQHCHIYFTREGLKFETEYTDTTRLNKLPVANTQYLATGDSITLGNKEQLVELLLIHNPS